MKKFFEELKTMPGIEDRIEEIKAQNLPVIIFGAGVAARLVTNQLVAHGLEIFGYAVDEKYYTPNQSYLGRPVFNFEELVAQGKKYIFWLALGPKSGADNSAQQKRFNEFLNDTRIVKYAWLPKVEPVSREFIYENQAAFEETYNLLEDEQSRKTMCAYLKTHVTEDGNNIADVLVPDEYFNELTREYVYGGGYVDCGAFDGDTITDFITFTHGNYSKIFAIEPDKQNFAKLKKRVLENGYKNVELFNCGVWNKKDVLHFDQRGDTESNISENGNITVEVDAIDNMVGDCPISLIKMDVEGAELNALKGAIKTMEKFKPVLALSAYHRKEDLITIPQFIKTIYKDCKFYLRKHEFIDLYGLDLYVIPK